MSKYYKAEDVIKCIAQFIMTDAKRDNSNVCGGIEDYIELTEAILADLPTIEPIEENGIFKGIKPTIEVSEDCISREYLKSFKYINKGDFNSVETIREWIDNAPSVAPSRAEGEWVNKQEKYQMAECSNCKKVTMHEMWGDKLVYYDYCPNCGAKMKV